MGYYIGILNNTSLQIAAIINRIQMQDELPQELVKPISGIWLGKTGYPTQWAGNGKLNLYVPYLAGKGDLIAFDYSSKPITAQFGIKYWLGLDHNELVISPMLQSDDDLQSIFPLIATLMFHTNDIDVSDDNFRQWLINNRPKVNKMKMHEDTKNDALFKFLQLREHADKVKITQSTGEAIWYLLLARAKALVEQNVNEIPTIDGDEWVLGLVNNFIKEAKRTPPKPFAIQPMESDERNQFMRLSFEYEQRCRLPMLSGHWNLLLGSSAQEARAVAQKVFGEPVKTDTDAVYFLFNVNSTVCRAVLDRHFIILDIHRESGQRAEIVCAIRSAIEDAVKKERENG